MPTTTRWKNEYGSVMVLNQNAQGEIWGTYSSTTGSSGQYRVLGHGEPLGLPAQCGNSLALAIYWRSYTVGVGDPSWHWVSGLGGQSQVIPDGGASLATPTLTLMHSMVVTDAFPGLARVGTYCDKLVYLLDSAPAESSPYPAWSLPGTSSLLGLWSCREDPALALDLQAQDDATGAVRGFLLLDGARHPLWGFTDVDAAATALPLQAVALTTLMAATPARSLSLAGRLERARRTLLLTELNNQGTAAGNGYLASRTRQLTFTPCSGSGEDGK